MVSIDKTHDPWYFSWVLSVLYTPVQSYRFFFHGKLRRLWMEKRQWRVFFLTNLAVESRPSTRMHADMPLPLRASVQLQTSIIRTVFWLLFFCRIHGSRIRSYIAIYIRLSFFHIVNSKIDTACTERYCTEGYLGPVDREVVRLLLVPSIFYISKHIFFTTISSEQINLLTCN